MKKHIKIVVISLVIFFITNKVYSIYYKTIELLVVAQIAEPILSVEQMQNEINYGKDENKIYKFTIKNYIEENEKISEVDFEYYIEIKCNTNLPMKFKLTEEDSNENLLNEELKTENFSINKNEKFLKSYNLEITDIIVENINQDIDVEIEIIVIPNIYNKFNLKAFKIEKKEPKVESDFNYEIIVSNNEYTNQNISLAINFNKEIKPVEGFDLINDNTTLFRIVENNEKMNIEVEDKIGNKGNVYYEINNIDKEPPEILGIENGKNYNFANINYKDNLKIKKLIIENISIGKKYEFDISELESIILENYVIVNNQKINPYYLCEKGIYEIVLIDIAGNETSKRINIK